jgi:hypothetical protein
MQLLATGFAGHSLHEVIDEVRNTQALVDALSTEAQRQSSELFSAITDDGQTGPRLFSLKPIDAKFLQAPNWVSAKFRLTLWCEYSLTPVPILSASKSAGSYEIAIPRAWIKSAAPMLKVTSNILKLATLGAAGGATDLIKDQAEWAGDFAESLGGLFEEASDDVLGRTPVPTGGTRQAAGVPEFGFGNLTAARAIIYLMH